jgi:predicted enzyme related to lactoylglutathione lyase
MLSAALWDKSYQRRRAVAALLKGLSPMKFASTRLVAADLKAMVGFYEMVTGQRAEWLAPVFAEIVTPSATLAIGSVETVALFKKGSAEPGANRTAIIEFQVDDVDAEFARLKDKGGWCGSPS